DCGKHRFARQLAALHIHFDPAPEARKRFSELQQAGEFGALACGAEVGGVTILLSSAGIDSGRLEMAIWIGAEPSLLVRRRGSHPGPPGGLAAWEWSRGLA